VGVLEKKKGIAGASFSLSGGGGQKSALSAHGGLISCSAASSRVKKVSALFD
jgi:hypothetical protein